MKTVPIESITELDRPFLVSVNVGGSVTLYYEGDAVPALPVDTPEQANTSLPPAES